MPGRCSLSGRWSGLALVVLLAGCSKAVPITSAGLINEERIGLSVPTCNATLETYVEETPTEVRVKVDASARSSGDCADSTRIRLDEPLGDRTLIDASTGEPIEATSED